jgi:hypothetical protein
LALKAEGESGVDGGTVRAQVIGLKQKAFGWARVQAHEPEELECPVLLASQLELKLGNNLAVDVTKLVKARGAR